MNDKSKFPISNPRQLKDWINNMAKKSNLVQGAVLQNYMMERFLERVSISKYRDNIILKGGFLIAAMLGIDMRSTMDIDTTIKGLALSQSEIKKIVSEILALPVDDNVMFELESIKPIRKSGEYEDFRIGILATFFTIKVYLKLDITTGDMIIPREIDYDFKLMFEERTIPVKAYNLNTILSEKIESILTRNVANTRARDYYDVYILLTSRANEIDQCELMHALTRKAQERGTLIYIEEYEKYLSDIRDSRDLRILWEAYKNKFHYAAGIEFDDIVDCLSGVFR